MKELRKDLERAIGVLEQSFLPENQQCDGGCCMGCWKDKVREAIKIIESLSSQSIEDEGYKYTEEDMRGAISEAIHESINLTGVIVINEIQDNIMNKYFLTNPTNRNK